MAIPGVPIAPLNEHEKALFSKKFKPGDKVVYFYDSRREPETQWPVHKGTVTAVGTKRGALRRNHPDPLITIGYSGPNEKGSHQIYRLSEPFLIFKSTEPIQNVSDGLSGLFSTVENRRDFDRGMIQGFLSDTCKTWGKSCTLIEQGKVEEGQTLFRDFTGLSSDLFKKFDVSGQHEERASVLLERRMGIIKQGREEAMNAYHDPYIALARNAGL